MIINRKIEINGYKAVERVNYQLIIEVIKRKRSLYYLNYFRIKRG